MSSDDGSESESSRHAAQSDAMCAPDAIDAEEEAPKAPMPPDTMPPKRPSPHRCFGVRSQPPSVQPNDVEQNDAMGQVSSSLPDICADPEGVDRLFEITFSEMQPMAPSLCVVMLQPGISTSAITPLGFITVHSCLQFASDHFRKKPCPARAKAVIVVQVGCRVMDEGVDCLANMSKNADAAMIIVLLIVPELGKGRTASAPSDSSMRSMARVQSRVRQISTLFTKAGADDVIVHAGDAPLQMQRLWTTMDSVQLQAEKFCQQVVKREVDAVARTKKEFEEVARRKMQLAWKKQIWNLPGKTFVNLPKMAKNVTESPSDEAGCVGNIQNYRLTKKLGQGGFGTVYAAEHPDRGVVAIKSIMKGSVKSVSGLYSIDQEVGIMRYVDRHPHIIQLIDVIHTAECIHVVMTYGGPVNFHRWCIQKLSNSASPVLPLDVTIKFGGQLASALAYLHHKRVCHRDLKPENTIVSDDEQNIRLTDFGLSMLVYIEGQRIGKFCGSLPFCAPEVLEIGVNPNKGDYDPVAADSWSLGACFAELLWGPCGLEKRLGWVPNHPSDTKRQLDGIQSLAAMWKGASDQDLHVIVKNLLVLKPEDRWCLQQVVECEVLGLAPSCKVPHEATEMLPNLGLNATSSAIKTRSVGFPGNDCNDTTLLEQVGGRDAIRDATVAMVDMSVMASPVRSLVDRRPADTPKLRELYVDVMTCLFENGVESSDVRQEFSRMRKEHKLWEFSNRDFDAMSAMFDAALKESGIPEGIIARASHRFRHMLEPATDAYHEKAMRGRQMDTAEWRSGMLNSPNGVERIGRFALALQEHVANKRGGSVPKSWRDPELIEKHLRKFLGGDPATLMPLPLDSTVESDDESLLVCVHAALSKAGFASEDAAVVLAVFQGGAFDRLNNELSKLHAHEAAAATTKVGWMGRVLEVGSSLARYPPTRFLSKRAAFAAYLGQLGELLELGKGEGLEDFATKSERLRIGPDHFNDLLLSLRVSCADLPPALLEQLLVAVQAMRPWAMVLEQHLD